MLLLDFEKMVELALAVEKSDMEHAYCSKDEKLLFVHNGTMYAFPWTKKALQILEDEGFKRDVLKKDSFIILPHERLAYWQSLVLKYVKEESA